MFLPHMIYFTFVGMCSYLVKHIFETFFDMVYLTLSGGWK